MKNLSSLPTVSALWDGDAVMRDYVVGDLILETLGVWTLALILSGLYLWWPGRNKLSLALQIKWQAGAARLHFDLHRTAGFYSAPVRLVLLSLVGAGAYPALSMALNRAATMELVNLVLKRGR